MNKIADGIVMWIKNNKKLAILLGVVIVILILLLTMSGKSGTTSGFLDMAQTIHNETYVADGTVAISNKNVSVNMIKSSGDYTVNASCGDYKYTDLFVKTGNTIYINDATVETQGGLLTLSKVENEDAKDFFGVIIDAVGSCQNISYETDEETQKLVVNTTEGWAEIWTAIYKALDENSDAIASGYSTPDVIKSQIKTIVTDVKKMAETQTIANTLIIEITPTEGTYELRFEMTMDMSMLPAFASVDDIDSNKFKLSGEIVFTLSDGVNISKPSGAIHAATASGIDGFLSAFWNSMFEKGTYVSFNQVSVTNDSVSLTRKLGETTEVCQIVFNAEGVTNAVWYITSPNEEIIDSYTNKYKTTNTSGSDDNFLKTEMDDGTWSLTISVSENGLVSFNKIAKNPKAMGEYLNSAKGGDIIV